eukprot:718673-Amphidinium_carterae.1
MSFGCEESQRDSCVPNQAEADGEEMPKKKRKKEVAEEEDCGVVTERTRNTVSHFTACVGFKLSMLCESALGAPGC